METENLVDKEIRIEWTQKLADYMKDLSDTAETDGEKEIVYEMALIVKRIKFYN